MPKSRQTAAVVLAVGLLIPARPADAQTAIPGQLLISEFRLSGPQGANDEFIEIFNTGDVDHTVAATSGTGYGIAASDGVTRCTIPNGTLIRGHGHYLCVNSGGYSLSSYAPGGIAAGGDASYATDIADNAGIAIFNNDSGGDSYSLANRLDAVGSTSEANTLYKEGAGYPALAALAIESAWVRDECGKGGAVNLAGPCSMSTPKDTDDNAADFYFVDTNGTAAGNGPRLGAPGPQNLSSAVQRNAGFAVYLVDATRASTTYPNRIRNSGPGYDGFPFGSLEIRRRFVNHTGATVTQLRLRIIDISTFPAAPGVADLRAHTTSFSAMRPLTPVYDADTCAATGSPPYAYCLVWFYGTVAEEPPSQPNGAAFNGSLNAYLVPLGSGLADGQSVNLAFMFGVHQPGAYRIYLNIEAMR